MPSWVPIDGAPVSTRIVELTTGLTMLLKDTNQNKPVSRGDFYTAKNRPE